MSGPGAEERIDGRQERTLRSRRAICDAYLDLVQEGVLLPSSDQIAERAGLSRRSIFNHFSDLAELSDAVIEAGMQRFAPLRAAIPQRLPVEARIARLAQACARFYEATTPFRRAMAAGALVGPLKSEAVRAARAMLKQHHDDIAALFAPELAALDSAERAEVVEALAAAVSPAAWEHLRTSRGLSLARARGVMERSLAALMRDAGVRLG